MGNIYTYKNKVVAHPGYYVKEYIDFLGITQEEFAIRLGTTPKNISLLIRGEQSLSLDIAYKLSKLIGSSVEYWLNLQNMYDCLILQEKEDIELEKEKEIFKYLDYSYFVRYFNLNNDSNDFKEKIRILRSFLNVSTLELFKKNDMYACFRKVNINQSEKSNIISNVMLQIATNISARNLNIDKFDLKRLKREIYSLLDLTNNNEIEIKKIKEILFSCGIDLIILPNMLGSKFTGATKKVNNHIMLLINDRIHTCDSFWFTLFHELGHIINGDFGFSYDQDQGIAEEKADHFASFYLIPSEEYIDFKNNKDFSINSIIKFSKLIKRNPGIIVGRLQNDKILKFNDLSINSLKTPCLFDFDYLKDFSNRN